MDAGLYALTLKQAVDFAKKEGAEPILKALQKRISRLNPKINAFAHYDPETAHCSSPSSSGSAFRGVPIGIKDNICIRHQETTCASKILAGHVPPYDAAVIEKIRAAGLSILGQCNMDEFAFGSSAENSCYGPVRNPWDPERVSGGSSGGSAAAVAADMALATLGSDTGGSIRQPAALCGVVGMKPTYGRVSRYGLIAFGSSFDQIGPITKTVEDNALLLNVIAGWDRNDSTSLNRPVPDYAKGLQEGVKDLRIGLPREYFIDGIDPEVKKCIEDAVRVLKKTGARFCDISLPHTEYAVAVYYVVAVAEASSNLGRFDGIRFGARVKAADLKDMYFETRDAGFGEEAKRRILLGTFVLSAGYYDAYYKKGQRVRALVRQDFFSAFRDVDLILTPTTPTPAFKIGEKAKDPLAMYLSDIFTIPASLAGLPAISVPCGFTSAGLPVGLQLMGQPFEEGTLYRAAYALEQELEVFRRKPDLKDGAEPE